MSCFVIFHDKNNGANLQYLFTQIIFLIENGFALTLCSKTQKKKKKIEALPS